MKIDLSRLHELINDIYLPAFKFSGRFLVLYGGSGSGKSFGISQKIIYRLITEDNHNILCVRKFGNSLHKSCFALLKGTIQSWGLSNLFQINEADGKEKIIFKPNGNQIIFSGLDDLEKLKSIYAVSSIWVEEASEVDEADFRELNRRMRGYEGKNKNGTKKYMQFMISFNPISQLHWLKKRFYDIDNKTLIWDSEQANNIKKVNTYDTLIIHSTYLDNKFIDSVYKQQMEELKAHDEYEYNVYSLGFWGVVGHTYFSGKAITERVNYLTATNHKPIKQGQFEYETYYNEREKAVLIKDDSIKWIDDPLGYIKIYEEVQSGYPYVIGGDTAGEGSDWNIGQVLNNSTDIQIATLKIQNDEDLYARQVYCLGKYYNNALIGLETNFSTHPMKVLTDLERL
jgi:phage terminase large subunit